MAVVDAVHGTDLARSLPREPAVFFSLLDSFLKQVVHRQQPLGVAVILPYVETLIPESSGESSAEDRAVRVFIQKWATDPALLAANVTFVLITENLADISSRIVRSPQTVESRGRSARRSASGWRSCRRFGRAEWFTTKSELPAGAAGAADVRADADPAAADPVVGGRARHEARRDAAARTRRRR